MPPKNFLERLRDRVVLRSQIGKRMLDRSAIRRELDAALRDLGERYRQAVREGRVEVPSDLAGKMEDVQKLERKLEAQDTEIAGLEDEHPSRKPKTD